MADEAGAGLEASDPAGHPERPATGGGDLVEVAAGAGPYPADSPVETVEQAVVDQAGQAPPSAARCSELGSRPGREGQPFQLASICDPDLEHEAQHLQVTVGQVDTASHRSAPI